MKGRLCNFFNVAKEISYLSDFRVKIGCVVVYKNTIISSGYNCNKTSPIQAKYNRYRNFDPACYPNKLHAECMALSKIRYRKDIDWARVKVFVYRESNGRLAMARPCVACSKFMQELGIKEIYYTGADCFLSEKEIKIDFSQIFCYNYIIRKRLRKGINYVFF